MISQKNISISGYIAAIALSLFTSNTAFASPTFQSGGLNDLFFNNKETLLRLDANCSDDACIADAGFAVDVPAGYQIVNPGIANNILVGDVFVGIFDVQNIQFNAADIWNKAAGVDDFSGYFAQEVFEVFGNTMDPNAGNPLGHLTLTSPSVDPFGILGAGESFAFYVDNNGTTMQGAGNSFLANIATATDGTLWATFGDGAPVAGAAQDLDGFLYSHPDLSQSGANITLEGFAALDFVQNLSGLTVTKINDFSENEIGGVELPPELGICNPSATVACNDVVGDFEITANSGFIAGQSVWVFNSNDPFRMYVVPTPGTLGMMGLGLLLIARRARKA